MKIPAIFELECQAQHYDWGRVGYDSLVAQLLSRQTIDPSLPYAELWMGIHPHAPSKAKWGEGILLPEVLKSNPTLLGKYSLQRWGTLPFLLKVLSIAQPLSIQMHPDKASAAVLHQQNSLHYPDANHKPELALALDGLESLYGFEPRESLLPVFQRYPDLQKFLPTSLWKQWETHPEDFPQVLQETISLLQHLPQDCGGLLLQSIFTQIQKKAMRSGKEELFLSMYPQFSQDLGLLFIFFMQQIAVPPQTALALGANTLHAYLQGNLIECMANSDNVIRAGMTKKFKDVEQLLPRVAYQAHPPQLNPGISEANYLRRYPANAEEFELVTIDLPKAHSVSQGQIDTPSILLTLSGRGTLRAEKDGFDLKKGCVVFIGAQQSYQLRASEDLQAVYASVPLPQE